jgi:hypothetical protein
MFLFVAIYASLYGDNIDYYVRANKSVNLSEIQDAIDSLNKTVKTTRSAQVLYGTLLPKLKTPLQMKQAVAHAKELDHQLRREIINIIQTNETINKVYANNPTQFATSSP